MAQFSVRSGDIRTSQKSSDLQVLAIHTRTDYSEMFKFKYFAAIVKGCASLPESEALLMQLYTPALPSAPKRRFSVRLLMSVPVPLEDLSRR
jgi:hypothetical protein